MEINALIAAVNDHQPANRLGVANFLSQLNKEHDLSEVSQSELVEYLQALSKMGDDSRSKNASKVLKALKSTDLSYYESYIEEVENDGVRFITIFGNDYPDRLIRINDPPLALYVKGDLSSLENGVAVVGTREANEKRIEFAKKIATGLVDLGYPVVSGMASGIDTAAHEGALKSGGNTVAIFAGDVDTIYPGSNTELADRIRENGALVSEVSDNVELGRSRFVTRNRITSGISKAVIIGASGETGGTIHQAKFAVDQERRLLLYTPEMRDGQSPSKIKNMGAIQFSSISEMKEKLEADPEELEPEPLEYKLDEFAEL